LKKSSGDLKELLAKLQDSEWALARAKKEALSKVDKEEKIKVNKVFSRRQTLKGLERERAKVFFKTHERVKGKLYCWHTGGGFRCLVKNQ
jgi:hypothetical protein